MSHLYRILGVPQTCSDEELKKAFQKKALLWHPDRQPDETRRARAEHMFKEISTSYNQIVQLRESGQDVLSELHQAEQAYRQQYGSTGFQHGGRAGPGSRHPGAGGTGNEHRDWQAHRAAYDKANRVPKDAPRRILFFCSGIAAMGLLFNITMMHRANSIEPSNQLIAGVTSAPALLLWHNPWQLALTCQCAEHSSPVVCPGRASLISLSKDELHDLWKGARAVQAEHATGATALPKKMRIFSGKSLAERIVRHRVDDVT